MSRIKPLARRSFLRATGSLIFLPMLEAMVPIAARAQSTEVPKRFIAMNFPYGMNNGAWTPTGAGRNYGLPANLSSLAPFKNRVILGTGIGMYGLPNGSHMAELPHFLGAEARPNNQFGVKYVSADVHIANHIKKTAPHTKLVTTATSHEWYEFGGGHSHGGYVWTGEMSKYISWSSPNSPSSVINNPTQLFDFLFGGFDPNSVTNNQSNQAAVEARLYRKARGLSILDSVRDNITKLNNKVGSSDRAKLDQYFTSLREVERIINNVDATPEMSSASCKLTSAPRNNLSFYDQHQAYLELYVLAMACDRSRVLTHMFDKGGGEPGRSMPWLGNDINHHHSISHEGGEKFNRITGWYGSRLAYLLEKMASYTEPGGDMLSNSVVVFGSGMGPGGSHDQTDLSLVIAGELGGQIQSGQGINFNRTRTANLYLSLMQKFGIEVDNYASSNGTINI